jgi:hypothetical protein
MGKDGVLLPQGKLSEGRRSWKRSHSLLSGNITTRSRKKMSGKPSTVDTSWEATVSFPPRQCCQAFFKHELRIRRELLRIIRQSIKTWAIPDSLAPQPFVYTQLQCPIYKRRDYCKFCNQGHCRGRGDHFLLQYRFRVQDQR